MIFSVPFNANYEKHLGPVLGLSCSPFAKRLFLSCSSDGSVRLYDTLGHKPLLTFEPGYNDYLLDVQWSPFRAAVFAAVSNHGHVYLFDLSISKSSPAHVLRDSDLDSILSSQRVASSISFNPRQRDLMAISYHDGAVRIYKLSYLFSNQQKGELKLLLSFLEEKGSD
jgi:WD40 repeat protein